MSTAPQNEPRDVLQTVPWSPNFLQAASLLLKWTVQRQLAQERRAWPQGVDPESTFYRLLANTREADRHCGS